MTDDADDYFDRDYFTLAMDVSRNVFAWYLKGRLEGNRQTSEQGHAVPHLDPQTVAKNYLRTYYPDQLREEPDQ